EVVRGDLALFFEEFGTARLRRGLLRSLFGGVVDLLFGHVCPQRFLFFLLFLLTGCCRWPLFFRAPSVTVDPLSSSCFTVLPLRALRSSISFSAFEPGAGILRMTKCCWAIVQVFETSQ